MQRSSSMSAAACAARTTRGVPDLAWGALAIALLLPITTAWARGRPPSSVPNPDVVYMSSSSTAPFRPAIRGVALTITSEATTSSDTQLQKALDGRDYGSIVWSPDGSRYAWIDWPYPQVARIMWARPGRAPTVLYEPSSPDDPYVGNGTDSLAWGPACSGAGSVLVFARAAKWDETLQQVTELPAIMAIDIEPALPGSELPPTHGSPRLVREESTPNAFALSSTGGHLVFNSGAAMNQRVATISMCAPSPTPTTLLTWDDFSAATYTSACDPDPVSACPCNGDDHKVCYDYPDPVVHSIDWSADDGRLALSVTVGPDPDFDWKDLRVAYLDWNPANQAFERNHVVPVDLDAVFGAASSEHSPQWGSGTSNDDCERLAFSQSAGVIDGSTMNGRRLYLHDLVTTSTACLAGPREIPARNPRAIDWK